MRRTASSPVVRRVLAVVSAGACIFAVLGSQAFASTEAPTINTFPAWDGSSIVQPFGCPDTTTYGETITVPAGKTTLKKFTFTWQNLETGSMVVRAEVYAWDGTKATGSSLYEKKKKISFPDSNFHNVTFKSKGIPVTAGSQYVLFTSIDKDYEKCTGDSGGYLVGWGLVTTGDPYTGGGFVYQNNSGNEANWTTVPWSSFGTEDVAFKASLS